MKKNVLYVLAAVVLLAVASCSKSGDVAPSVSATGKYTLNGVQYTEIASVDSTGTGDGGQPFNLLYVSGTSGSAVGQVGLIFAGSAKPKAGVYKVVGSSATTLTSGQVGIIAFDNVNIAKQGIYGSAGTDNVSVTVSVSSTGKLSATFPAVALTGTNYDNTDSKNTVITTVNITVSGSVVEN
jgi:hypothetical protein